MRKPGATVTATREGDARSESWPQLVVLFECRRPAAGGARFDLAELDEVHLGRGERRAARPASGRSLTIEVPDGRMSTRHGRIARLAHGWAFEDLGSKNGSRVAGAPVRVSPLTSGDVLELGETLFLFQEGSVRGPAGEPSTSQAHAAGLTTLSPALAQSYEDLSAIACADVPLILLGETGTGKEVAARAVHQLSRRKGRFVAVNCGALPQTLVEAELFGSRQGAYTGAVESRVGLVRSADRGTLFLDEIGDLPLPSQAALLRVLQEREVTAVGETAPTAVDVRVVAATHRDLRAACAAGTFRPDLLARLEGYSARLPPLRERRCDLGLLLASLLERLAPERAPRITVQPAAARALCAYDFPGNVRELEQLLRASLALARDDVLTLAHLPERVRDPAPSGEAPSREAPARAATLSADDQTLRDQLCALLASHQGSINGVARALGKDRTQIKRWMTRFEIDPEVYR